MPFRAFLDANVLVGARERDVFLTLGEAGVFDPLWSDGAIEEMLRHLPHSMNVEARQALLAAMTHAFPEANVRWSEFITIEVASSINPKDRHIVAGALWGHADVLVTYDGVLRDELERSKLVDAQAPAEFIAYAIDVDAEAACEALLTMVRQRWLADVATDDAAHRDRELLLRLSKWMTGRVGWLAAAHHLVRLAG